MTYDKFEVVREFAHLGYKVPMDVAVSLMGDGYDISSIDRDFDGFDIYDLIDEMEKYDS